jgi:hypothetical protein
MLVLLATEFHLSPREDELSAASMVFDGVLETPVTQYVLKISHLRE